MKWSRFDRSWLRGGLGLFWSFTLAFTTETTETQQPVFPAEHTFSRKCADNGGLEPARGRGNPPVATVKGIEPGMDAVVGRGASAPKSDWSLFSFGLEVKQMPQKPDEPKHGEPQSQPPAHGPRPQETQASVRGEPPQCVYYRLEEGRTWTYAVHFAQDGGALVPGGKARVTNLRTQELEGKTVTPQIYHRLGSGRPVRFYTGLVGQDADGVYELATQSEFDAEPKLNKPPRYIIRYPIRVGSTWREKEKTRFLKVDVELPITYAIVSVDEVVTVPAGQFRSCLMIEYKGSLGKDADTLIAVNITVEQRAWFAPGIGLVKSIRKEESGGPIASSGELKTELVAYR